MPHDWTRLISSVDFQRIRDLIQLLHVTQWHNFQILEAPVESIAWAYYTSLFTIEMVEAHHFPSAGQILC